MTHTSNQSPSSETPGTLLSAYIHILYGRSPDTVLHSMGNGTIFGPRDSETGYMVSFTVRHLIGMDTHSDAGDVGVVPF